MVCQLVTFPVVNTKFMYSYLFVHDEIKMIPKAERIRDKYWKGIVKEIRQAPHSASRKSKVCMLLDIIIFSTKICFSLFLLYLFGGSFHVNT